MFVFIGISVVYVSNDQNYRNYFLNFSSKNSIKVLRVTKVLKPNLYYNKYEAKIIQIGNKPTKGKLLLSVAKDSVFKELQVDEKYLTTNDFVPVSPPLNPYQFDYANYLKQKGITHQLTVDFKQIKSLGIQERTIVGFASRVRNTIQKSLMNYNFKDDVFGVISALLLGQRSEISNELITNYSKAGAIHILAVSGLHVGIILLILSQLFKPLESLKNGKYIKAFFIIILLWMFAFVAGLSASVVRAVTMFTFVSIGMSLKSKQIIEHSLFSSMFVLLLCKPSFLFDVGFQMSYLAVFGIVWFQPQFQQIWQPKYGFINKAWQLFTVSFAAQLGVLPLSLFYFHQFPGLFFISNLVVIPFLGFILMLGIVVIAMALLNALPLFLSNFYAMVIETMNTVISFIADKESFLIKEISFTRYEMLFYYLLIFLILLVFRKRSAKRFISFLVILILFQSFILLENHSKSELTQFVVFHKSRQTIFGIQKRRHFYLNAQAIENQSTSNILSDFMMGENIKTISKLESRNYFRYKNIDILVIDSLGVYNVKGLTEPIVLLSNSPKINLQRLIKTLQPIQIVVDGNNYKSLAKRWEKIALENKTPFHYTGNDGAFILNAKD